MGKKSSKLFFLFALFVFALAFVNCEKQAVDKNKQTVNQYDAMLDRLEKTVDEYAAIMDRVKAGNIYALQDVTEKLTEMRPILLEIGAKVDLMDEAQKDRFAKIVEKQQAAGSS
jgi:Zn-dependent M32 family carboxypeptidase